MKIKFGLTVFFFLWFSMSRLGAAHPASHPDIATANVINRPIFSRQNRIRALVAEQFEAQKKQRSKKFTILAGVIKSKSKDNASTLKSNSTANLLLFGYKFAPKISASVMFVKNMSKSHTDDEKLTVKSTDRTMGVSLDYKLLHWLTFDFSLSKKHGEITTTQPSNSTVDSISKNIYTTLSLTLKMLVPINKQIFLGPSIGLSRTYMHNKAYTDNSSIEQPSKDLTMDQLSTGVKLGMLYSPEVVPYISTSYGHILSHGANLKARGSYRYGAGAMLFGGILSVDWSTGKSNKSVSSQSGNINLSGKF